ncbi:hypothetical protein [Streptomyces sp. NRRL F-5053]|uniref:hypothetical protein n=1 Tax=Streptomyces sp. NRRL F-5053 TaxID=1463854 RepID=UPI00068F2F20|nr:hypothetical protein [Streptomyces sp. NRRL F-5053]
MNQNNSAGPTGEDVSLTFGSVELTGSLEHDDKRRSLVLMTDQGPERISVNLTEFGLTPASGHVYIKDWSEHSGLTAALERAGLVELVAKIVLGPYTEAFEVAVLF